MFVTTDDVAQNHEHSIDRTLERFDDASDYRPLRSLIIDHNVDTHSKNRTIDGHSQFLFDGESRSGREDRGQTRRMTDPYICTNHDPIGYYGIPTREGDGWTKPV